MTLFEIFPTIVSKSFYDKNEDLKNLINDILIETDSKDIQKYDFSTHYYEQNGSFIEHPLLVDFKKFLLNESKEYLKKVYKIDSDMLITLGWINQVNAGHRLEIHNHANSIISGTYFLNYDDKNHAALNFYKGNLGKNYQYFELQSLAYDNLNASNCEFKNIKEGNLLLWPSHLEHGYNFNSEDNRITISMNFMPSVIDNGRYRFKIVKI